MLEERLLQLGRRAQVRHDSSSDDDSSDEGGTADKQLEQTARVEIADGPGAGEATAQLEFCPPADEPAEWERLAQGQLKARGQLSCEARNVFACRPCFSPLSRLPPLCNTHPSCCPRSFPLSVRPALPRVISRCVHSAPPLPRTARTRGGP